MVRKSLVLLAALTFLPAPLRAQVPAGPVFTVSTATTVFQGWPDVACDAKGAFAIVWWDKALAGSDGNVQGRRFESDGTPRGGPFQVNLAAPLYQWFPAAGLDARGRLTVVWRDQTMSTSQVKGRRFDGAGAGGAEFAVGESVQDFSSSKALAVASSGDFVVAWGNSSGGLSAANIYGRRFARSGQALEASFRVNTSTTDRQQDAAVGLDAGGAFVVVWHSQDPAHAGIFGQRYDAAGAPRGGEFRVAAATTDAESYPAIAVAADGRFVVAWDSASFPGDVTHTVARVFDPSGAPRGAEFQVASGPPQLEIGPRVAADEAGAFTVVWQVRPGNPLSDTKIQARRFEADGQARGNTFTVADLAAYERNPEIASDAVGNIVVSWEEGSNSSPVTDILGQRFGGLQPAALAVDTVPNATSDGNGVWEPLEMVDVRPSWRNVNGAAQTVSGTLTVDVPHGGTSPSPPPFPYAVLDTQAEYGSVPDHVTGPCTDCYTVAQFPPPSPAPIRNAIAMPTPVHALGQRPDGHLDATVWETITPEAQGQHKKWLLHLGETFTDVLRASPFYRFIETLVHNGVTAGCGATTYCPAQSVTREQMAVFVLTAEDRDAAPPACTTPVFGDVPAGSPFCRWVEELARRGVTAGCTATTYCPGDSVTREQMAVFVLRTFDPTLDPPACTTPMFSDLPASSPYCRWVEELARRGVVAGCGGGRYCGADPVTREQMAVYLTQTFGLRLYGP